jgi:hypothetical protein
MHAANGVGLAAQQVGVPVQLTVIDVSGVEDSPERDVHRRKTCEDRGAHAPGIAQPSPRNAEKKKRKASKAALASPISVPTSFAPSRLKAKAKGLDER